jgi:hypothetical protein
MQNMFIENTQLILKRQKTVRLDAQMSHLQEKQWVDAAYHAC